MSTHFDGAKLMQFRKNNSAPRKLWQWCIEHYGLIGALFALLGAFSSLLTIWFYLGEIDGRDLFIPAMLDSKVWGFVIFAGVLFLFVTVAILAYAIFSAVLILRTVRIESRLGSVIVKAAFLGVLALSIFSVAVLGFIGTSKGLIEYAAAFLIYLGIVVSPVWFFHKKLWQEPFWWMPWMVSIISSAIFLLVGGAEVSKHVVQLAGIRQEASQSRYYLFAKELIPAFRGPSAWKLGSEGKSFAVCGYKIFQLSDITVLCPSDIVLDATQNDRSQFGYCVRLKSSEMAMMPINFVPASNKDANDCVKKDKPRPRLQSHKYSMQGSQ